jgi:hypothetical protein
MRLDSGRSALIIFVVVAILSPRSAHAFGFGVSPPVLDPKTYVSPSGRYTLLVDPTEMHGRGRASYRLSRDGREVWSGEKPFSLWYAAVNDEGVAGGYAYSEGLQGSRTLGDFHVVILAEDGSIRLDQVTKRERSAFPDEAPNPVGQDIVMDDHNDRLLIRVGDPDVNLNIVSWWVYRISTGERRATFRPCALRACTRTEVKLVAKTPLMLLNWSGYDMGHLDVPLSQFALIDLDGRSVWTLRAEKGGEIAACPRAGHFAVIDRSANQKIEFSTRRDVQGQYVITEIHREPAPPRFAAAPPIAIPDRPLRYVGRRELADGEFPAGIEKSRDLDFDIDRQDWYPQPGTGNHWVVAYKKLFLIDRAGTMLKIIERCPDRKWLAFPQHASVAPDGSLAVIARGAVNLYSATGEPIRAIPMPVPSFHVFDRIGYSGKWVAFVKKRMVVLLDCSAQKWQQFSPTEPGRDAGWHPFFTADVRELHVFDGMSTFFRYELPRG